MKFSPKVTLLCIFVCFTSPVFAQSANYTDFKDIMDAYNRGWNQLLSLLSLILAVVAASGYGVYRFVRQKLESETRNKILENESRNMIRLGIRDYDNFKKIKSPEGVAHSSLLSAITHTRQAWFMAINMSVPITDSAKSSMMALAGSNLAYYYVELVDLLNDSTDADLQSEYRSSALEAINNASSVISACYRRKEVEYCKWWDIVESRLYVEYKCLQNSLGLLSSSWKAEKSRIKDEILKLKNNTQIPLETRLEISKDWREILQD